MTKPPAFRCAVALLAAFCSSATLAGEKKPARTDLYGDPLPAGAVARLGAQRQRGGKRANKKARIGPVLSLAFSPNGRTIVTGGLDGTVRFWDTASGEQLRARRWHKGAVQCIAISPDGRLMASGGSDISFTLRELATGKVLRAGPESPDHFIRLWSLAFSPDGKTLAWGSVTMTGLWDVGSGKQILGFDRRSIKGAVAFCPGGRLLASGEPGGTSIRLWDTATRKTISTFGRRVYWDNAACSLAFSPDGKLLASAHGLHWLRSATELVSRGVGSQSQVSDRRMVRLWDVKARRQLASFEGHVGEVLSVAFSPDGTVLASASLDCTVRLRDVWSGEEMVKLLGHSSRELGPRGRPGVNAVNAVAFSPDGKLLATGGSDGTALLWDLDLVTRAVSASRAHTLDNLWTDLAAKKGPKGYSAYRAMARRGDGAVKFLARRLRPLSADPARIKQWIADLDADKYAVRKEAGAQLELLGVAAEPALREAQRTKPSPGAAVVIQRLLAASASPVPLTGEARRVARAVAVLERIRGAPARRLLTSLTTGHARAPLTELAKAALQRRRSAGKIPPATQPATQPATGGSPGRPVGKPGSP